MKAASVRLLLAGMALCATLGTAIAQTTPAKPKPEAAKPEAPKSAAPAPAAKGPDSTTETYGDWLLRCWPGASARPCQLSQRLMIEGQSAPIALIAFESAGKTLKMQVQLPHNVTIPDGVKVVSSTGDLLADLPFRACVPGGCVAVLTLADPGLAKLKGQTTAPVLKFKDAGEREIALPFSTKGLSQALDALAHP